MNTYIVKYDKDVTINQIAINGENITDESILYKFKGVKLTEESSVEIFKSIYKNEHVNDKHIQFEGHLDCIDEVNKACEIYNNKYNAFFTCEYIKKAGVTINTFQKDYYDKVKKFWEKKRMSVYKSGINAFMLALEDTIYLEQLKRSLLHDEEHHLAEIFEEKIKKELEIPPKKDLDTYFDLLQAALFSNKIIKNMDDRNILNRKAAALQINDRLARDIEASVYYMKGLDSIKEHKEEESLIYLQAALDLKDDCEEYKRIIDELKNKKNRHVYDTGKAVENYNKSIDLYKEKNYEESISYIDKALEIHKNYIVNSQNKEECLINYEEALRCYDKALEVYRARFEELRMKDIINEAHACRVLKKYDEAINLYDKVIEQDGRNADALVYKGYCLCYKGKHEEAIKYFNRVLELDPKHTGALKYKGYILCFIKSEYNEALNCYDKVTEIDPEDYTALKYKGFILYMLDKYQDGIRCYDKALGNKPEDVFFWINKGDIYQKLGDEQKTPPGTSDKHYREAMACYDKALNIDPHDPMALNNKGDLLLKQGNNEGAITFYLEAFKKDPAYAITWASPYDISKKLKYIDGIIKR